MNETEFQENEKEQEQEEEERRREEEQEEKRKEKQEEKKKEVKIQKPMKKIKIEAQPKMEKEYIERKAPTETSKEIIKKEKEIILTDDEKQILVVLDFVDQHKSGLKISGFQIKDFLESIFSSKDVDKIYFQLKEKEFISKTKDSEEFLVSYRGRQEAKKHNELLKSILEDVGVKLEKSLKNNELLKRILYLSSLDESKLKSYLLKINDMLSDFEQVLVTFFLESSFRNISTVSKIIRHLRKEQSIQIIETLENFCQDLDFLKSLAILRLENIKDKIGIETIDTLYYKNYYDILSEIMEERKTKDILNKLLSLGITTSENLFEIDLDDVLTKEGNISKLKEWLIFDEKSFKNRLEFDWNLFLNTKNVIEYNKPYDFKELIKTKAVLLYRDNILIRKKVGEIFDEVYENIKKKLKNVVKGIDNVIIVPFLEIGIEKIKELKGKIIISLHAYDWWSKKYYYSAISEEILEKNVILLISPKEIEFEFAKKRISSYREHILDLPDKNIEFNAIGKFKNLHQVKSIFNACEWILEEEYYSVKRAKDIIEDKKIPKITLDEFLEEIKRDEILTRMLFLVSKLYSHNPYYKSYFWSDIANNILSPFNISYIKFEELKKKFTDLIEKRVKSSFEIFYGKNIHERCKEELIMQVINNIKQLDEKSKKSLYVFLLFQFETFNDYLFPEIVIKWLNKFRACYRFFFDESFSGNIIEVCLKVGLIYESTWISWKNNYNGVDYKIVDFFDEIKLKILSILKETLEIKQPKIKEFLEEYEENIFELIGLDYLLFSDGICKREEFRDTLWNISLEAWNKFESYDGIISSKEDEFIVINPLLLNKLRDFIYTRKKEMIENQKQLKNIVLSLNIIDHKIEFDEKLAVFNGFIITRNKDEIKVIITPWYLPIYKKYFGDKTLIVITHQLDYKAVLKSFKEIETEIVLIFLKNKEFYVFSNFRNVEFINSIISILERNQFTLISKKIMPVETLEVPKVEEETFAPSITKKEVIIDTSSKEEINLFEELFKIDLKTFPVGLSKEGPVVLIVSKTKDDDYSATLRILCREIYRELIKGLPYPKIITDEELEEEIYASDRIVFIDENKAKKFGLEKISNFKDVNWYKLGKKLQQLFSQYFGFIIFEIPSEFIEEFRKNIEKYSEDLIPQIIQISPKFQGREELVFIEGKAKIRNLIEFKSRIASLLWGFVTPQKDVRWKEGKTFDNFFTGCENEFKKILRRIENQKIKVDGNEISVPILVKRSPIIKDDLNRNESDLHFQLKVFIVKYLYEKQKYPMDSVKTEYETQLAKSTNNEIVPDVQVGNEIFEVETLYSSEKPLSKIVEKVENYRNRGVKVNIVLKNIDVFLYYKDLIELEEQLKDMGIDVEFKTLDLEKNVLINARKMGELYRSLFQYK